MEDERDRRSESLLDLPLRQDPAPADGEAPDTSRPSLLDSAVELGFDRPRPEPAVAPEPTTRRRRGPEGTGQGSTVPHAASLDLEAGRLHEAAGDPDAAEPPAGPGATAAAAPLLSRFTAGLIDAAVHLGLVGILFVGTRLLGARLSGEAWSVAVMVLAFSSLYTIPTLLVWGRTPGAAVAGLAVRQPGGGTPAPGQCVRRWVAQWVTWLLAGLPGLVRLADRWSGTRTVGHE